MVRTKISRRGYLAMCIISLFFGIVMMVTFSTIGIFYGFNYYIASFLSVGTLVIGFGVGISVAHAFDIEGLRRDNGS